MKINVEFDLTPDEFRQALGLPDVEAFQQHLLDNIQRQMESGVEGYDPMSLMRPFLQQPMMQQGLSQGLSNFGTYQQMMLDMLKQAGNASTSSSGAPEEDKTQKSSTTSTKSTDANAKATASSRSRAKRKAE
ncbi:hypothetical protein SAMN04487958_10783 [Vreelandella subterranea]|uniref:Uncharacterized protein n=1 Tax=Vreelandella subterranea TaxID=416874 RepID=A0A1H9UMR7_9GAMM|nr:hypothetical protein [Halomonas subterranea]SES10427.1 hypothetical protein SAMN04487958_10783 [Halomonas subterranea]